MPTRSRNRMRQYTVGALFEQITLEVAVTDLECNRYISIEIEINYFSKRLETFITPNQKATTVAEVLVNDCTVSHKTCTLFGIRKTLSRQYCNITLVL